MFWNNRQSERDEANERATRYESEVLTLRDENANLVAQQRELAEQNDAKGETNSFPSKLKGVSKEITQFVGSINNISEQTNLLAFGELSYYS